ncbi:MAG TPA: response regulator, partial [Candidatus Melainabacteria bacterium]|nr:response regulator [Candidatus Melainabacteria bacterium]
IRRRIPLISIAIGIVSSTKRRYQSYVDVLTSARDYRYLSKQYSGSTWVTDSMPEPVQDEDMEEEVGSASSHEKQSRILVVEPDGPMALLLQDSLTLEGYVVQVTSSADDALELARHEHPDLILLESNLSDRQMDGWSLCRTLKDDEELKSIWLVMATSHPDQSLALEAGADLYLPKPFDMPSLINEISTLLRSSLKMRG